MKKLLPIFLITMVMLLLTSCLKPNKNQPDNQVQQPTPPIYEIPEQKPVEIPYEDRVISQLTLDEKLGQLIIIGFPEGTKDEDLIRFIKEDKVGGFILFRRNYNSFKQLYELNAKLKSWNKENPLPLFISVDEEGGTVSRIPKEGITMPDAKVFGDINDASITRKSGEIIGKQLKACGINLNFAPVLDILSISDNKLLRLRSYGKDADIVSRHGISYIEGLNSYGIIAAPKHFPGHGNTSVDSHGKLPIIDIDKNLLEKRELVPFKNAVKEGIDAIMVGHLAFPKIDETSKPATKSRVLVTDILRDELGFKGIAITDEIEMYGFMEGQQSIEDAVIESFNAGMDIFVIGHTKEIQNKVMQSLKDGVLKGLITEERVDESLRRIIQVKKKYELSDDMNFEYDEAYKLFMDEENKLFAEEVRRKKR